MDAVLAVRSAAQMSRDGISDDYEGYRHKGREYEDLARRRQAEIAQLDQLLAQLGDTEDRDRKITSSYETVHGVVGDTLMNAIQQLAVAAGTYWRHERPIGDIDRQITLVQEHVALLRHVEHAADRHHTNDQHLPHD